MSRKNKKKTRIIGQEKNRIILNLGENQTATKVGKQYQERFNGTSTGTDVDRKFKNRSTEDPESTITI